MNRARSGVSDSSSHFLGGAPKLVPSRRYTTRLPSSTNAFLNIGPSLALLALFTGVPVNSGLNAGTTMSSLGQLGYLSRTCFLLNPALTQHFSLLFVPRVSVSRTEGWMCPMTSLDPLIVSLAGQT